LEKIYNKGEMSMSKIKLYTCKSGVNLYNKGETFLSWTKEEADEEGITKPEHMIPFLVNPEDVRGNGNVIGLDSVEFIK
jgi:hypothetical protein